MTIPFSVAKKLEEQFETIENLLSEGKSAFAVANQLGIGINAMNRFLRNKGLDHVIYSYTIAVKRHPDIYTVVKELSMVSDNDYPSAFANVAIKLGVDNRCLRNYLRNNGLDRGLPSMGRRNITKLIKPHLATINNDLKNGVPLKDIADRFAIKTESLRNFLYRNNNGGRPNSRRNLKVYLENNLSRIFELLPDHSVSTVANIIDVNAHALRFFLRNNNLEHHIKIQRKPLSYTSVYADIIALFKSGNNITKIAEILNAKAGEGRYIPVCIRRVLITQLGESFYTAQTTKNQLNNKSHRVVILPSQNSSSNNLHC